MLFESDQKIVYNLEEVEDVDLSAQTISTYAQLNRNESVEDYYVCSFIIHLDLVVISLKEFWTSQMTELSYRPPFYRTEILR